MRLQISQFFTGALGVLCALGVATVLAQSASDEYKPAQAGIHAGSAAPGPPRAGSLGIGKPSAGSLPPGRPTAGSLGGSIGAGSIAPSVGVPLNSISVPMSSLGSPMGGESLSRSRRPVVSDDLQSSRTRRSRSRR